MILRFDSSVLSLFCDRMEAGADEINWMFTDTEDRYLVSLPGKCVPCKTSL